MQHPLVPIYNRKKEQQQRQDFSLQEKEGNIENAETPEIQYENLGNQFSEVDDEFHDSRGAMDIGSEDDVIEPDDTDVLSVHRISCMPISTKLDREELRIVRNNFAEECDPRDTSMVSEYAEEIFRCERELEVMITSNVS